ncbi:MAG: DUF4124 domain-containing protein [Wenzhouxiangella sp.]|nr:MAG: DUF4124 domain-containing protein [Wenzhouxiangella sp.]
MRLVFAIVLLSLLAASVQAQVVYRWTDETGEVHYGHAVPPEHAHRGFDRMGPDGTVRERVERALTEEERAERAAERRREAELAAEQRSQETRDRLLLAAYGSEDDIIQGMTLQLNALDHQRASVRDSLRRASGRFEDLVSHAARLTHDGQTVPDRMNQNIAAARDEVQQLRRALEEMDEREQVIRDRSNAELTRFRELTGGNGP